MSTESEIYSRLSTFTPLTNLVDDRIYPTVPTENTQLPFLVYQITGSVPQLHTQGASSVTNYALDVNTFAPNLDTVLGVLNQTKAALHCYRTDTIQGSFLTTQTTAQEEDGHHGQQSYSVWAAA